MNQQGDAARLSVRQTSSVQANVTASRGRGYFLFEREEREERSEKVDFRVKIRNTYETGR